MTRQELEQAFDNFFKVVNNQRVDFDGVYGAQCFDVVQKWNREYLKSPFIGGDYAYQIYGQLPAYYDSIPNTPDAIPKKGDIMVWSKNYNGFAGHTGVATGKGDLNTFECLEQNDPTGSITHLKTYNYNYVVGWLRLKTTQTNPLTPREAKIKEIAYSGDNDSVARTKIKDLLK